MFGGNPRCCEIAGSDAGYSSTQPPVPKISASYIRIVNNPVLSNVKDEAISIIRRDQETAMKVMAKYMKTDNRKTLEAVYEEPAPVFQRLPLMTKEESKPS